MYSPLCAWTHTKEGFAGVLLRLNLSASKFPFEPLFSVRLKCACPPPAWREVKIKIHQPRLRMRIHRAALCCIAAVVIRASEQK